MSRLPTKQEVEQLQAFIEPLCLTIYAPYIDPNTPENPIRIEMKNLLREAKTALLSAGADEKFTKKTLRPITEYMEQYETWTTRHESLVFFSHPHFFKHYHIPDYATPYMLTVETGFNVGHLLDIMADNQAYYVLALGHKNVRLYRGDRYAIAPVQLANLPADMKGALNIDEYSQSRQTHPIGLGSEGRGSGAFHQQYNVRETDKILLEQFFRRINKQLHRFLLKDELPLLLAGVKYLEPIYRKVNTYPGLVPGMIEGNHGLSDLTIVREKAWKLLHGAMK